MKKNIIVNKKRYRLDRLDFAGYLKLFPKSNEEEFEKLTGKKTEKPIDVKKIEKPIEIKKDASIKEDKKLTKKTDKKNSG